MSAAIEGAIERGRRGTPARPGRRRADRVLRLLSLLCLAAGLLLLAGFAYGMADGVLRQRQLNADWQQRLLQQPAPAVPQEQPAPDPVPPVRRGGFAIPVPPPGLYPP